MKPEKFVCNICKRGMDTAGELTAIVFCKECRDTMASLRAEIDRLKGELRYFHDDPECTCYETFSGHQPGCPYHGMAQCKECGQWFLPIKVSQ